MTSIPNGLSEIDSVILQLPDLGKEIINWESYSLSSRFLDPCDSFTFTISGEDLILYQEILTPGAKIDLAINDRLQCTGYIDDRQISYSVGDGTRITLSGRDILSRLVNSYVNPSFQVKTGMTVQDVIGPLVSLYKLGELSNTDDTHLNIMTGLPNNQSLKTTITKEATTVTKVDAQGKVIQIRDANGQLILDRATEYKDQINITANIKPGLNKITLKELKPNPNEGAYAYVDRCIKREGLILKAVADGSGVMVISPTFTGPVNYHVINKKTNSDQNNVITSNSQITWFTQPSIIIATGASPGGDFKKATLQVAMINELIAFDNTGNLLPDILNILAEYKSAKLVNATLVNGKYQPTRPELVPKFSIINNQYSFCPLYLKDDQSKDLAQLQNFTTRKMAECQMKSLSLKYTVVGHTQNGHPWATNTLVSVDDDIHGIHENMWVMAKTFNKSYTGGTTTNLELIRPFTLILGGSS